MKCKDCPVPPMYDILKIASCVVCLDGMILMNILRFILTEKMVVFTENQPLKNGIRNRKKVYVRRY